MYHIRIHICIIYVSIYVWIFFKKCTKCSGCVQPRCLLLVFDMSMDTDEMSADPPDETMKLAWQQDMQRLQMCDSSAMWQTAKPQSSRNSTLTVFNHKAIMCSESGLGDRWNVVQLTVLKVEDAGFSKAPFSKTLSKAKLSQAKPLATVEGDSLRLWSFIKAPMSKGDRLDDVSVSIEPGDVFAIFMDTEKFKQMMTIADKSKHLLPTDGPAVIPPFSLLQMTVTSKNGDTCQNGSIVNIQSIRPCEGNKTVHSCFPMMRKLQGTLNDSLVRLNEKAQLYPNMSKDLLRDKCSFFREQCNPVASVDVVKVGEDSYIRVSDWSNDAAENLGYVDMPVQEVLRLTNCSDLEHSLNFLAVAFAMQAVSLLVVNDDYWGRGGGSSMRGVPIVSWQKIMKCSDAKNQNSAKPNANAKDAVSKNDFCTNEYYDDGDGPQTIMLHVDFNKTEVVSEENVTAFDFPIVFPDLRVEHGYNCTISLAENNDLPTPKAAVENVVRFTIETGRINTQTGASRSTKRRKLTTLG